MNDIFHCWRLAGHSGKGVPSSTSQADIASPAIASGPQNRVTGAVGARSVPLDASDKRPHGASPLHEPGGTEESNGKQRNNIKAERKQMRDGRNTDRQRDVRHLFFFSLSLSLSSFAASLTCLGHQRKRVSWPKALPALVLPENSPTHTESQTGRRVSSDSGITP